MDAHGVLDAVQMLLKERNQDLDIVQEIALNVLEDGVNGEIGPTGW